MILWFLENIKELNQIKIFILLINYLYFFISCMIWFFMYMEFFIFLFLFMLFKILLKMKVYLVKCLDKVIKNCGVVVCIFLIWLLIVDEVNEC